MRAGCWLSWFARSVALVGPDKVAVGTFMDGVVADIGIDSLTKESGNRELRDSIG